MCMSSHCARKRSTHADTVASTSCKASVTAQELNQHHPVKFYTSPSCSSIWWNPHTLSRISRKCEKNVFFTEAKIWLHWYIYDHVMKCCQEKKWTSCQTTVIMLVKTVTSHFLKVYFLIKQANLYKPNLYKPSIKIEFDLYFPLSAGKSNPLSKLLMSGWKKT